MKTATHPRQTSLFDDLLAEPTSSRSVTPATPVEHTPVHLETDDVAAVPGGSRLLPPPLLTIIAYGTPGPQGSKSSKGRAKSGKTIMVESSAKVKPWREIVAAATLALVRCCDDPDCFDFKPGYPVDGPLLGRVVFTLRKPVGRPKTKVTYPDRYPDVSKILRSTEDAITGLAWADDARIVDYSRLAKVFPGEDPESLPAPGVRMSIWHRADLP